MSGFNTLWLPGTDHAGIATQMIVEKELKRTEGVSRHDLGREEFLRRVWTWKEKYGSRIGEQHQALGAALDWQRERFTMDEGLSRGGARGLRAPPRGGARLPREEAHQLVPGLPHRALGPRGRARGAHAGELWSFAYPLADGSGEIVVATTRPETMLGDTAVAVHPDDERYRAMIGKNVRHPLTGREFPIVADAILVDPEFGTGAVKVTPAHDFNDFETGKRHGLEQINGDRRGRPDERRRRAGRGARSLRGAQEGEGAPRRAGARPGREAPRPPARPLPALAPSSSRSSPTSGSSGSSRSREAGHRGGGAGEDAVRPRAVDEHLHGVDANIHDWCISRQLWWGHQIPAWYCPDGHVTVARDARRTPGAGRAGAPSSAGRGRARHLVLVGALAVLDDGLAGGDARRSGPSTRRR
jgi:valyl-tRNA synthetase